MAAFLPLLFTVTAAVLLCGALTGEAGLSSMCLWMHALHLIATHLYLKLAEAQEVVRNFQATKNSTHITFSWDIVDGYYSSSYINSFRIYYRERPYTGFQSYFSLSYSSSSLIKIGPSFQYTTTVTSLSSYGHQFVMWVYVSRRRLNPSTAYSDQIYVEMGKWTKHTTNNYWHKPQLHMLLSFIH